MKNSRLQDTEMIEEFEKDRFMNHIENDNESFWEKSKRQNNEYKNDMQKKTKKRSSLRPRIVFISQKCQFLTESEIILALNSHKMIEKWAYIKHDKDLDEDGTKDAHWHIILQFKDQVFLCNVADWFNVQDNMVVVPKGRNAFIQCAQYLTHETQKEQNAGKYKYDDSEVKSNFKFREEIDNYIAKNILKDDDKQKALLRKNVLLNGLKLSQISHDDYALDWQQLQKCRAEYIRSIAQLPSYRMNFYITGGSGTGKSLSSRALAKTLIDPENMLKDEEVFFTVGQGASMFAGYDGQPVIIWDDLRAMDLLKQFNNNPGAVFNLFDVIPSAANQNIKFGSVKLINTINIVNSVQKFDEFVDQICFKNAKSEMAEPDKQMYRRFPFFVELSTNQKYDFFVNKQFFNEDEPNYKAYLQHKNLGIGLLKIDKAYKKDPKIKQQLTNKHFEKVGEEHKKAVKKYDVVGDDDVLILQQQLSLELEEIDKNLIEVVDYEIADKEDDFDNKLSQNYGQNGYPIKRSF